MLLLDKYVYEDKNLEKAFEKFEKENNLLKEETIYRVDEEKAGLLKSSKYVVTFFKKEDIKNLIEEFLNNTSKGLKIEINSEIKFEEDVISINLNSNDASALIGKNGKMLNSLQMLIKKLVEIQTGMNIKINLDVENYKKRKINILEREVKKIIKEVLKTKVDAKLDPMNSYERRIVHNVLGNFKGITTESEGEEPNRKVVIKYKEKGEE